MGLPEALDDLSADTVDIRLLGDQSAALVFPIVLCGGWDAVSIVAPPDHTCFDQLVQGFPDLRQAGVRIHRQVQGRGDVLSRSVYALHILKEADRLGGGLCQRVFYLVGNVCYLAPDLAWYVP